MEDFQKKVKDFTLENNMVSSSEICTLDLVSEVGEVSKEILKMTNYGKESLKINDGIKGELGDVFYSLITLANSLEIDLNDALNLVLRKYEKRLVKGSAGSENE